MKGRFLVLEGIDGCGKSTQIKHLSQWLPDSGLMPKGTSLHLTREPGGTALGEALLNLLLHPPGKNSPEPLTELLLYAADRAQHIEQVINPALMKGDWVISDRFTGSTLAYQGYGRELNIAVIKQLESIATKGLEPDLTLWLDIPVNESINRRGNMIQDRIEAEGASFLNKVSSGFNVISQKKTWVRIKAGLNPQIVTEQIEKEIITFIKTRNKRDNHIY